jgi:hypothetical protein
MRLGSGQAAHCPDRAPGGVTRADLSGFPDF